MDDQTFSKFEAEFRQQRREVEVGLRVYEPLLRLFDDRSFGKNRIINCCTINSDKMTWLDLRRWEVFNIIAGAHDGADISWGAQIKPFEDQSVAVIFCSGLFGAGTMRRSIYEFVREARRVLINGGILVWEIDQAATMASTVGHSERMDNVAFLNYALEKADFSSREILRLKREASLERHSEADIGYLSASSIISQKGAGRAANELTGPTREALHQVASSLAFPIPSLLANTIIGSYFGGSTTVFDFDAAVEAYNRWNVVAKSSEEALAALSDTALGTSDISRRLLKVERRILELRKQTSIFFPLTYPWSHLATRALKLIAKRKAQRRENRLNKKKMMNDQPTTAANRDAAIGVKTFNVTRFGKHCTHPRILILKLDHIGDLFLSFRAIDVLKSAWPEGHFTLVCSPTNADLARASGLFEEVIEYRFSAELSQDVGKIGVNQYSAIKHVLDQHYDIALDLRHDPETRPLLAFVKTFIRAGFQSHGKYFTPLDISIPQIPEQGGLHGNTHNMHRLLLLAHHIVDVLLPGRFDQVGETLIDAYDGTLPLPSGNYVVLAPGAGTSAKKWGPQNFADLARLIVEGSDTKIVVLGGPAEQEYSSVIAQTVPANQLFDLIGKLPLTDMAGIIAGAIAFVGCDTGATHLAALLNIPTISIFSGVADVDVWKPVGEHVCIIRAKVACAPCKIAKLKQCVADHVCMTMIDVKTVFVEVCKRARWRDRAA